MSLNNSLRFVSKTSFQGLAVESGEESESEEEVQVQSEPEEKLPEPAPPVNPTASLSRATGRRAKAALAPKKSKRSNGASDSPPPQDSEKNKASSAPEAAPSPSNIETLQLTETLSLKPAEPGSASNPLTVEDDTPAQTPRRAETPNGLAASVNKPQDVSEPQTKSTQLEEHAIEVIGPDGAVHGGNIEVHVSSSEQVVEPLPTSMAEKLVENVSGVNKSHANVLTRSLWTFVMIGGFITLLLMGHIYMIILVLMCQTIVFREVTALFSLSHKEPEHLPENERRDPWSKTLNWYFFAVANYFLYGETIIYYFKHIVFADIFLLPFATNHRFISFTLYCIGFVGFVTSLKKEHLKRQFSLFGWVHMTLLLIVASSHFIVNNILEGMIWFWVPASLVICNDTFAYIWGVTTGRTPLLALSPKKTVEGFVGAIFSTLIFGFFWGTFFMRFNYMICPVENLGVTAWSDVQCKPNTVFIWKEWRVPFTLILPFIGKVSTVSWAPYQFHLLVMSTFASLVAPFGGFFASGFKRAFKIKDFGDSIPGHGGMTDRMDCQFLMGLFSYVYYSTTIREHHVTVGSILQAIVSGLTIEEQLQLYGDLKRFLEARGVMP